MAEKHIKHIPECPGVERRGYEAEYEYVVRVKRHLKRLRLDFAEIERFEADKGRAASLLALYASQKKQFGERIAKVEEWLTRVAHQ